MAALRRSTPAFPRQWNPQQVPNFPVEIDGNRAPRGLTVSILPAAGFTDLVMGTRPVITGSPLLAAGPLGVAMVPNGGYLSFQQAAPAAFSLEALVYTAPAPATTTGVIGTWNDGSALGGTFDRTLMAPIGSGFWAQYIYDGSGRQAVSTTPVTAGSVTHVCGVFGGTQLDIYVNGIDTNFGSPVGPAYNGYGNPYLLIGNGAAAGAFGGQIALFNYANVAWSASEVAARARVPFGMFRPIVRRQYFVQTAGGSGNLSGTAAIASAATGTLSGAGRITGTAAIVSAATGTLAGLASLSGTAAIVSTATGTLASGGSLSGTAAIISTATGTLTSAGHLAGTAGIVTTATGTLAGSGHMSGTAAIISTATGTLTVAGALSGTAAIVSTATGTLTAAAYLSGTAAIISTATGTLIATGTTLSGTAAIATSASGKLVAVRQGVVGPLDTNLPTQVGPIVNPLTGAPTLAGQYLLQRLVARTGGLPGINVANVQSTAVLGVGNAASAQSTANVAHSTANTANANAVTAQDTANTAVADVIAETARAEAAEALLAPLLNPAFTAGIRIEGGGGPTWTAGSGVPSGIQPNGSLYSNSTGTTGTRLYVSSGAGTWLAVAGV